ncbi:MAG: hypothetical protein CVU06_15875, partial [Bacteroidetes bacterium HGW-Bacteroidetes-22]
MYMKAIIVIVFMLSSFAVFSQEVLLFQISVFNSCSNRPVVEKKVVMYDGIQVIGGSYLGDDGIFTYSFDSLLSNSDSIYFIIETKDSLLRNNKVFINNISLIADNVIGSLTIRIIYFNIFTRDEYFKWC